MKIGTALAVAALLASAPVLAEEWIELTETASGSVISVDAESLRMTAPGEWRIWKKEVERDGTYSLTQWDLRCGSGEMNLVAYTNYRRDGTVDKSGKSRSLDYSEPPPGSVGSRIITEVCRVGSAKTDA